MVGKPQIYLDNAAATPMDAEVLESMQLYFMGKYGNPSALYTIGREAKSAIDNAREDVSKILNCNSSEIIFTGSGTESDNLAIFGITDKYSDKGKHVVVSNFEHHAILHPCEKLEKQGFEITYLKVDKDGLINIEQLKNAIRKDTILISIMYANNEIGTVESIQELAKAVKEKKKQLGLGDNDAPFFHTDACQCPGYLDIDVSSLGVDLMTINGSKIYGPKGTGMLFVKKGIKLEPLIMGGGQEMGMRAGTENVAGIIGFAKALEIAESKRSEEVNRLGSLRDKLIKGIQENISGVIVNGDLKKRLPNNVNISIPNVEGQALLFYLDEYGISASIGSACNASDCNSSHVIKAIGGSEDQAQASVRFSLGRLTTAEDIDYVIKVLPEIVEKLKR